MPWRTPVSFILGPMFGTLPSPTPPGQSLARSRAFRDASLRSERRRAYAVMGVLALMLVPIAMHEPSKNGLGVAEPSSGLPLGAYINVPILVMINAAAAAWVAYEIRGHLEAALGEVETRHRMARIEQDLSIARTIQQALLPRGAPGIPG